MARSVGAALVVLLIVAACGDAQPIATEEDTMELNSSAFEHEATIPARYTCDGDDISPPLQIGDIPASTESLALIMDDPDAPGGTWDHWIAYDIQPTDQIPEDVGELGVSGTNSSDRTGYSGPCPPSGTHRYVFRIYALDGTLGLPEGSTKEEVLAAMEGRVLGSGTLIGTFR